MQSRHRIGSAAGTIKQRMNAIWISHVSGLDHIHIGIYGVDIKYRLHIVIAGVIVIHQTTTMSTLMEYESPRIEITIYAT